ncbi:ankyrin repeat domain-containing protein [Teredinibacter turnerae]|uniref:ankyrin repeat domain-containing protein n=1 Tax=Teredinibacter turnerae TaxID=2426 RepID=UPI0005F7B70B|nr:ankyrin repeat domain-containing protein [Teredinibacter turnerae]
MKSYRRTRVSAPRYVLWLMLLCVPLHGQDLHTAIVEGNLLRVQTLLADGVDPNQPFADTSTPLAWATDKQSVPLVKALLEAGAKPVSSAESFSALVLACLRGNREIIHLLLDAGAKVNQTNAEGIAPLALCAGNADLTSVKRLLDQGAELTRRDLQGQTALMWAAAKGREDIFRFLVSQGANINAVSNNGFSPLFFAIKSGSKDAAFAALELGADVSHRGPENTSAVQLAMYQQLYSVAQALIEKGVDLNAFDRNGYQLLHAAVIAQQAGLVKLLLGRGADPNSVTGESRITWRYEVNFTSRPYVVHPKSPLLLAAERGSKEMMAAMIAAGANPDFRSDDGNNVLLAVAQSNPEAMAYALTLVKNVNRQNQAGQTALHRLMTLGTDKETTNDDMAAMFKLLAAAGARTDIADNNGTTAYDIGSRDQYRAKDAFLATFNSTKESVQL